MILVCLLGVLVFACELCVLWKFGFRLLRVVDTTLNLGFIGILGCLVDFYDGILLVCLDWLFLGLRLGGLVCYGFGVVF